MKTHQPTQRPWRWLAAVGCLVLLGLQMWVYAKPQSQGGGTEEPRPRSIRVTNTNEEITAKRIDKQLDEILEVQTAILKRYDELMEELQIVKTRATR